MLINKQQNILLYVSPLGLAVTDASSLTQTHRASLMLLTGINVLEQRSYYMLRLSLSVSCQVPAKSGKPSTGAEGVRKAVRQDSVSVFLASFRALRVTLWAFSPCLLLAAQFEGCLRHLHSKRILNGITLSRLESCEKRL